MLQNQLKVFLGYYGDEPTSLRTGLRPENTEIKKGDIILIQFGKAVGKHLRHGFRLLNPEEIDVKTFEKLVKNELDFLKKSKEESKKQEVIVEEKIQEEVEEVKVEEVKIEDEDSDDEEEEVEKPKK